MPGKLNIQKLIDTTDEIKKAENKLALNKENEYKNKVRINNCITNVFSVPLMYIKINKLEEVIKV